MNRREAAARAAAHGAAILQETLPGGADRTRGAHTGAQPRRAAAPGVRARRAHRPVRCASHYSRTFYDK